MNIFIISEYYNTYKLKRIANLKDFMVDIGVVQLREGNKYKYGTVFTGSLADCKAYADIKGYHSLNMKGQG